jgi:hypothetical protein
MESCVEDGEAATMVDCLASLAEDAIILPP